MDRIDAAALRHCLAQYRRSSPRARAECAALELRCGRRSAELHACRKLQQAALGRCGLELVPADVVAETIGGLRRIWPVDQYGVDLRRCETILLFRQLQHLKLSRYEPDPWQAIALAEAQQQPAGDAA